MDAANRRLLEQLCGPGDFLTARRRTAIVRETLACTAACPACLALHAEGRRARPQRVFERIAEARHSFSEPSDCGGLGAVVHAAANQQHIVDARWHEEAAEWVWRVLEDAGEVPRAAKEAGSRDDRVARLCEVIDVVAATVGIRAYCRAMGRRGSPAPPALPASGSGGRPHFERVVDFCASGLHWDERAWGPRLEDGSLKRDVLARLGMVKTDWIRSVTSPYAPGSKWEPAPKTAFDWFGWAAVAYPPMLDFFRLFGKWDGLVISRLDMEEVASSYTAGIRCKY